MSLMDFYREIADLAGAPMYYESLEVKCFNCGKDIVEKEAYKTKQDMTFCSIECYETVFYGGSND